MDRTLNLCWGGAFFFFLLNKSMKVTTRSWFATTVLVQIDNTCKETSYLVFCFFFTFNQHSSPCLWGLVKHRLPNLVTDFLRLSLQQLLCPLKTQIYFTVSTQIRWYGSKNTKKYLHFSGLGLCHYNLGFERHQELLKLLSAGGEGRGGVSTRGTSYKKEWLLSAWSTVSRSCHTTEDQAEREFTTKFRCLVGRS